MRSAPNDTVSSMKSVIDDLQKGGGGGWTLISSNSIITPVEYFDVALPSDGLLKFVYKIVVSDPRSFFAAALSFDGGSTFLCDTTNFDSYAQLNVVSNTTAGSTPLAASWVQGLDSLIDLDRGGAIHQGDFMIDCGDTTNPPVVSGSTFTFTWPGTGNPVTVVSAGCNLNTINPQATVPIPLATADLVRFVPNGNADCNPPTSGITMTGSWGLFGLPGR
jgi:hypothetical protein